jgi:purine-binding chemotaxis protein CheW
MREQRTTTEPDEESGDDEHESEPTDTSDESELAADPEPQTAQSQPDEEPAQPNGGADDESGTESQDPANVETNEEEPDDSADDAEEQAEQSTPEPSADEAPEDEPSTEAEPPGEHEETTASYQVIEFELGDDRYGVDITRADEVLAYREVTRVPNTPDLIRGVVDIRGQIITVIDPTTVFDPRGHAEGDGLIVVFEVDLVDGSELIGWAVDNVLSVHTVDQDEIVEPPEEGTTVEAALEREDGYLTLTTPESLLAATGTFGTKIDDAGESELSASG